jgi:hypothetical protein
VGVARKRWLGVGVGVGGQAIGSDSRGFFFREAAEGEGLRIENDIN